MPPLESPRTGNHHRPSSPVGQSRQDEASPRTQPEPPRGPSDGDLRSHLRMDPPVSHNQSAHHPSPRGRFFRDASGLSPGDAQRSQSGSPFRLSMPYITPGQLAFSAMQYLPVPCLVLNNLKTVVLANEAMGRMLGMSQESSSLVEDNPYLMDALRGQSLSQVGIDMLQDGRPVWVTWEAFLDSLILEMGSRQTTKDVSARADYSNPGDATPKADGAGIPSRPSRDSVTQTVQDAVVEVVISRKDMGQPSFNHQYRSKDAESQIYAKMIVTIWEIEDHQVYFTLTFTSSQSPPSSLISSRKSVAKSSILEAADRKTISNSNPPSVGSSHDSSSPSFHVSPAAVSLSSSPFPPMGPPSTLSHTSTPSILQKMILMKDALLDNTEMPIIAMWKDGSVIFPNRAARLLFQDGNEGAADRFDNMFDLLPSWQIWNEDFTKRLEPAEFPVSILIKTEKPFSGLKIGMRDLEGKEMVFDVLGEAIRNDHTGEFLAGVITLRDITKMTQEITEIRQRDEERFRLICDTMPQLVWTTTPDGSHDFFNTRWYTYTGLTPEDSLGLGWKNPFHPDDMPETARRWQHSLETGEPYVTEYRCLSKEGEWRWFLGRALPLKNKETGVIEKWFGTCTDVHEGVQAKISARQTRQQLLSVIALAHVTIFTVDINLKVTMLEGALIWDTTGGDLTDNGNGERWYIGQDIYQVFNRMSPTLPAGERPKFLQPIETILSGKATNGMEEHGIEDRWYRTRFLPIMGKKAKAGGVTNEACVEGVIGVIMDVTELKEREQDLEEEAREKRQAMANEAAAKEANRLKSQFLANMSHEIRTPITGVIGMAELLGDMELEAEEQEYVENIQRSANALLTVINDILDFSKIESGRLDIEEVQFSLSVVVKDVSKMLSFAAERKSLDFQADIAGDIENDLVVIGDPGRVRQIITNLLTNSIKFTNQGYVNFSVQKEKETSESIHVKFTIEDTGIGIEEDVRKKLFQPFSQGDSSTARRFGGTGLGLTICKNLLDLMHGEITLQSNIGSGTVATFWIPFSKPQGRQATNLVEINPLSDRLQSEMSVSVNSGSDYEQQYLSTPPGAGEFTQFLTDKNKSPKRQRSVRSPPGLEDDIPFADRAKTHILVVEDNAINQQIATKTIMKLGFSVTAAWNGKEALEYLTAAKEGKNTKPDIILMDVQMPVIDGYKCTHLLRHHIPYKAYVVDVPIVAMTASAIQGDREKCKRAGMDDYLAKPVKSATLEKMLVRWTLSRRRNPLPRAWSNRSESDCSEAAEHCSNADIPGVGVGDYQDEDRSEGEELQVPEIRGLEEERQSPLTPRPLTTNGGDDEVSPFEASVAEAMNPARRMPERNELAMHVQAEKLLDAAGGRKTAPRGISMETVIHRDSLTEENVEKLEKEEQQRRG